MDLIISSIIGGIFGLIIAIIFEEPLRGLRTLLTRRVKQIFYRKKQIEKVPELFSLGKRDYPWLVIDGDGESNYTPKSINCIINSSTLELPPEIIGLREQIQNEEFKNREKGLPNKWNGPLYSLERYAITRLDHDEQMGITLTFRPTDYYTFQATVMSLDKNLMTGPVSFTLRQKYLSGNDFSIPIPFLANGVGLVLVLFTKDRKLILSRRSDDAGTRNGEFDASVVEGLHPILDRSNTSLAPDIYRTAIRGTLEEVGVELMQQDISLLGFGVDIEYYQWNIVGMAETNYFAKEVLENRRRGISGKWENKTFEIIDSNPEKVFKFLAPKKIWATAMIAIYWALVHQYGRKKVDNAADAIFK